MHSFDQRLEPMGLRRRVALVVGNDRYPNLAPDAQLARAVSDGRLMRHVFHKLGFSVVYGENLGRREMVDLLSDFTQGVTSDDLVFFFFAGHGVALDGSNYLLPADVHEPKFGEEGRLRNMSLSEQNIILDIQERQPSLTVTILDACRSNPFRRHGVRNVGLERGLVRNFEQPEGVFSIYSAGIGQAALDSLGPDDADSNSVFTRVFAPTLQNANFHLVDLIIQVRQRVANLAMTVGHKQVPAYYDQTLGGRIFLSPATPAAAKSEHSNIVEPSASTAPMLSINTFLDIQDDCSLFVEFVSRAVNEFCERFQLLAQLDVEALRLIHASWQSRQQVWLNELVQPGSLNLDHLKIVAILLDQFCRVEWILDIRDTGDPNNSSGENLVEDDIWTATRRNVADGRGVFLALNLALSLVNFFEKNRIDRLAVFENRITVSLEHDIVVYLFSNSRNELGIFLILKAMYLRD